MVTAVDPLTPPQQDIQHGYPWEPVVRVACQFILLVLAAGAASAQNCEGFLSANFFQNHANDIILDCAGREGLDSRAEDGSTALHFAAAYGDAALVRTLLVSGADLALLDRAGLTPLDAAVVHSTDAAVVASLLAWGAPADANNSWGRDRATTPLMRAAARPEAIDILAALLAAGADPHWRDDEGNTALHWALRTPAGGEAARLLLRRGAAADTASDDGTTPLHVAASYSSDPQLADILVDAGASADAEGPEGVTPLMLAATYATEPSFFDELLYAAEEPCKADENTRTARLLAEANPALRNSEPYWRLNQLCPSAP